ncbi:uncharacterized protein LOC100166395 isoform X1 [Acyrthosiphon pisum]|uniref:Uncharacterized protein n=2 Tax=Acyrthosiphon pisum TaxID=7029 RepID=A0A8R2D2I9_ACYPI|nr:uncharacterized protein LOC100166395 isoform X1 [Acyrthosiphon pisum]|eukprot:XP_016658178.1 PREDICTED: uncharacterized protein LOC100166395 isoform X1 [Acyrthosiphon pisum]
MTHGSMLDTIKHILKPKIFMLWIVLFTLIVWTYSYYSLTAFEVIFSEPRPLFLDHGNSGYLINTSGCRIPEMYLNGPEIEKCFKPNLELNCKTKWNYNLPLITSDLTSLILNMSAWATLNISDGDPSFECYYIPIERSSFGDDQDPKSYSDDDVKLGEKVYFVHNTTVSKEMVEVVCTLNSNVIYKYYHIFIQPTSSVRNRKYGEVSILLLGLDAVSRMNFHRQMPKTSAFLSEIGTVEMTGYNKVEDNTFPNVIPTLTGMSIEELKINCWPENNNFFDKCNFVWDDYKDANFSTAFAEDSTSIGMFNYLKSGFLKQPTDHYLRPIMTHAENVIGHESIGNTIACLGPKLGMTVLLDYAFKMSLSLTNHLYMNVFWTTSLTHDYIEYPKFGDDDLRNFFDAFNKSGELNKTIVILMSDHGIRWGCFRDTYQGSLEDKLPLLNFIIPQWFQNMYPSAMENLNKNTIRLTTPYDLHQTLLDFIDIKQLDDNAIARRTKINNYKRGTSLFLEIPENKSCETAGIPKNYCACHEERQELVVDDVNVVEAAKAFMQYVNFKLSTYNTLCTFLTLHEIHKASVEMRKDNNSVKDYEIQVTTVPGFAKFEATLRHYNGNFKMVGSVSRLNLYGNQSICMNDAKMKLLCYCIHEN